MREDDFFEDDDYDYDVDIEMIPGDERQKEILKWLADSPLAESIEGGSGADFFIRQGSPVRLQGGFIVEAVSWLDSEGFELDRHYVDPRPLLANYLNGPV